MNEDTFAEHFDNSVLNARITYPTGHHTTSLNTGTLGTTLGTTASTISMANIALDAAHNHNPYWWNNGAITGTVSANVSVAPAEIFNVEGSGHIRLSGDKADITVNGVSLTDRLSEIEKHLNILRPRKELEGSWDELRELREAYEAKLAEVVEAERIFGILKS